MLVNATRLKSFPPPRFAGTVPTMKWRVLSAATFAVASCVSVLGCKGPEAPAPVMAPVSVSERAVLLLANDARALGRLKVSNLRGYLSAERLDELGELILSRRFRLPVDVSREVDEIQFAAYAYDKPDAVALLHGHFRATELREALARESALPNGTAKEAPSVNGERFYRVGQGDVYVAADDLLVVGSRAGMERFLKRSSSASPLAAFPVVLAPDAIGAFQATGPRNAEELPPAVRQQALVVGLREASGLLSREGSELLLTIGATFASDDLAREAQARALPFARLIPTWTRNALPAATVTASGATVSIQERIDAAKLEVLAGTASTLVPR